MLDHSVESDQRLRQYTKDIFAPPQTKQAQGLQLLEIDCTVQCTLPVPCTDSDCAATRDLVTSLRTTIEVLEAEVNSLQEQLAH